MSIFQNLGDQLTQALKHVKGQSELTEKNIQKTLDEMRVALLDADVALVVVDDLLGTIRRRCAQERIKVVGTLNPRETLIKVLHDTITETLGSQQIPLNLKSQPPAVILLAGLQGSGKTTTTIKLAHFLKTQHKKSVMVTSTDVYRPAAIEQLAHLADQAYITCHPSHAKQDPLLIAKEALTQAKKDGVDVLIIDTAGRLHIDKAMMREIQKLHKLTRPIEMLFVVDSMTGQDAANTAKAFHEALPLTGVILTKIDGDARGGAALSMRALTGKPIKFIGTGEKIDAFEVFHPDRIAGRLLDMGDILSLVETVHQKIDQKKADRFAKKIKKGKAFTFDDFLEQLQQLKRLGGLGALVNKLPGLRQLAPQIQEKMADGDPLKDTEAIILSMTSKERRYPGLINGSRKKRIARGSGTDTQQITQVISQFNKMQKMMKKMKNINPADLLDKIQR